MDYTILLERFFWLVVAIVFLSLGVAIFVSVYVKRNVYTIIYKYSKENLNSLELSVLHFLSEKMLPNQYLELHVLNFEGICPPKFKQDRKSNFVFLEYQDFCEIVLLYKNNVDNANLERIYTEFSRYLFSCV